MEKYPNVNWPEGIKPLLKKYKNEKHPLDYKTTYQLIVMVILSAQDSDKHINKIAPMLFEAFPDMKALSKTTEKDFHSHINDVRNSDKKTQWLLQIAQTIKDD
ncbi:MAG: endonuclease III, partial [Parafilimonas sp.]